MRLDVLRPLVRGCLTAPIGIQQMQNWARQARLGTDQRPNSRKDRKERTRVRQMELIGRRLVRMRTDGATRLRSG
jgi:hypothetical protein